MPARKGGSKRRKPAAARKPARKPARRTARGGGAQAPAWFRSNWFLLVIAAGVLIGVQLYHGRRLEKTGSADSFGETPAEAGGAGAVPPGDPTPAPPPPPSLVRVDARPAVGSERGEPLGTGDGPGLLAMAAPEGELPVAAAGDERGGGVAIVRGQVDYRGIVHDEVVVPTVDRRSCPEHPAGAVSVADGHLAGALVWVEGAATEGAGDGPEGGFALRVDGCQLRPRAQALPPGTALRAGNGDDVAHTLVATDAAGVQAFRVELPAGAEDAPILPTRPGLLQVTCERHSWERAHLLVHPAAAATDIDGRFTLDRVPLPADGGGGEMSVFHPELGTFSQALALQPDQTLELRIDLTEPVDP